MMLICNACGLKHGQHEAGLAAWQPGKCEMCGAERGVTDATNFGEVAVEAAKPVKAPKKVKRDESRDE